MSTANDSPRGLWKALDFQLSEILRYDLFLGLAGGGVSIWAALTHPSAFEAAASDIIGLLGIVVGAVIAGVAVLAAFLDQPFLRKLKAIKRNPIRYMAPFLFTALLGVVAGVLMIVTKGLTPTAATWLRVTVAGLSGWFSTWTLASIIPALDVLVQFVNLQVEAAEVDDDADILRLTRASEAQNRTD